MTGREEEWRLLRGAWERSVTGRRQLALVAGEPGIGKTRLVMEFARSIAAEGYVLLGRCDQEALVPQQPFVEALEWYARQCPPAVLEGQLANVDGVWELAQLVAPLARRVAVIHEPVESDPEGRRVPALRGGCRAGLGDRRETAAADGPRGSSLGRSADAVVAATLVALVA